MPSKMDNAVSAIMRDVAMKIVMPRYRNLQVGQISEKTPGELVTVADIEAEDALREALGRLETSARIVGEEASEKDSSLLDDIGTGAVWIIDPVDGTKNFAAGTGPFGMMVAFVVDGQTQGAWIYCPVTDRMCHASQSEGAWINGTAFAARPSGAARPVAALATQFMPPALRESVRSMAEAAFTIEPIPGCAAEHYPRIVMGTYDLTLFQRTHPWDHAAGVLFLQEAGGKAVRWDGSEYRVGDDGFGLLAAATPELWDQAAAVLFAPESGLKPDFTGLPL